MPKIGRWIEVEPYECCNNHTTTTTSTTASPITTTTTTTAESVCRTYEAHGSLVAQVMLIYEDCEGEFHIVEISGNEPYIFCALGYEISSPGTVEVIDDEGCSITTTTTTTSDCLEMYLSSYYYVENPAEAVHFGDTLEDACDKKEMASSDEINLLYWWCNACETEGGFEVRENTENTLMGEGYYIYYHAEAGYLIYYVDDNGISTLEDIPCPTTTTTTTEEATTTTTTTEEETTTTTTTEEETTTTTTTVET